MCVIILLVMFTFSKLYMLHALVIHSSSDLLLPFTQLELKQIRRQNEFHERTSKILG